MGKSDLPTTQIMYAIVYHLQWALLVNQDNPVSKQYQSAQRNGCTDKGWLVLKMSADMQKTN